MKDQPEKSSASIIKTKTKFTDLLTIIIKQMVTSINTLEEQNLLHSTDNKKTETKTLRI